MSFADPAQGHRGGIYQAMSWIYAGESANDVDLLWQGRWYHRRMIRATGWGGPTALSRLSEAEKDSLPRRVRLGKYRYLFPLDRAMRRQLAPLAQPYPRAPCLSS